MKRKKLYRSRRDRVFGGVCGGLAEYFDIDPTLVRLIAVVLAFVDGIGILAYLLAWLIIPLEPQETVKSEKDESENEIEGNTESVDMSKRHKTLGVILVILGAIFLIKNLFGIPYGRFVWPLVLIGIGVYLILRSDF